MSYVLIQINWKTFHFHCAFSPVPPLQISFKFGRSEFVCSLNFIRDKGNSYDGDCSTFLLLVHRSRPSPSPTKKEKKKEKEIILLSFTSITKYGHTSYEHRSPDKKSFLDRGTCSNSHFRNCRSFGCIAPFPRIHFRMRLSSDVM